MTRTLEVALGLGGAYLFLSIIVLALVEGISSLLGRRAKDLRKTLDDMLSPGFARQLYEHPLVQITRRKYVKDDKGDVTEVRSEKQHAPSYVGANQFSQAVSDLIVKAEKTSDDAKVAYKVALDVIPDENARKRIGQVVGDQVANVEEARRKLEAWFNNSMDRLSGDYKRNTQWFSRGFAVALVVVLNVNTITMAKVLWNDPEARAAAVKEADRLLKQCREPPKAPVPQPQPDVTGAPVPSADDPHTPEVTTQPPQAGGACPDAIATVGDEIPFPMQGRFWDGMGSLVGFFTTLLGLLLSIWAVSLGAPFWFDTMRKISGGIQQTGPKPKQ